MSPAISGLLDSQVPPHTTGEEGSVTLAQALCQFSGLFLLKFPSSKNVSENHQPPNLISANHPISETHASPSSLSIKKQAQKDDFLYQRW